MTLRSSRRLLLLAVAVVVIQVGALQQISIAGAHPDLFLLMAICAGLVAGAQLGAVVAFCWGLLADLFVITPFGLSALCFVLVAFAVGEVAADPGGRAPMSLSVTVGFAASLLGTVLYAALSAIVGQPHLPFGELAGVLAVVSIGNAVLALPVLAVTRWVFAGTAPRGELAGVGQR